MNNTPFSIYIHIPFCKSKCPYCDFYSARPEKDEVFDRYLNGLCERLEAYGAKYKNRPVHTVYFGGGTPSVFGAERLWRVLEKVKSCFDVTENAEITTECNPADVSVPFFETLKRGGFNRISMGMQSANEAELKILGRRHTAETVREAVQAAREAGIDNVSVDLMLGLPNSNLKTLKTSIDFCAALDADHVSAYILKIEPGTPFAKRDLKLPDEDGTADQYLFAVEELKKHGYDQYEISNFARSGKESRHNLQYWRCGEYLGLGPAAHSFMEGERFYFPRDLEGFLNGNAPVSDGAGGGFSEFAMLALRLTEGLQRKVCETRFKNGDALFDEVLDGCRHLPKSLVNVNHGRISLTAEGFLVSNAILAEILPE